MVQAIRNTWLIERSGWQILTSRRRERFVLIHKHRLGNGFLRTTCFDPPLNPSTHIVSTLWITSISSRLLLSTMWYIQMNMVHSENIQLVETYIVLLMSFVESYGSLWSKWRDGVFDSRNQIEDKMLKENIDQIHRPCYRILLCRPYCLCFTP